MPEEGDHENYNSKNMRSFEELITEQRPNGTMRHKGKPGLEDDCDDTSPVKDKAGGKVLLHVVPANVIDDEWKGMQ